MQGRAAPTRNGVTKKEEKDENCRGDLFRKMSVKKVSVNSRLEAI